jgi:hypothetical protein
LNHRVAGIGIVLVAVIVVLLVVDGRRERTPPPAAASPPVATALPAMPVAPAIASVAALPPPTTPTAGAPLPPLDAPLAEIANDLLRRADAGDSAAACRLGIELVRCQRLMMFGREQDLALIWQQQAISEDGDGRTKEAERLQALADRFQPIAASCRSLPDDVLARGPELLRAAALAGEPEALLRQASGSDLFPGGAFGMPGWLDSPEFDRWRHEAPQLLRRALATGRPEVVLMYANGYAGGSGPIEGLLPDDVQQAAAWRALARRMFGSDAETRLQPLLQLPGEVDVAAAEAQAERWHVEYFDGAKFEGEELLHPELAGFDDGTFGDIAAALPASACGQGGRP